MSLKLSKMTTAQNLKESSYQKVRDLLMKITKCETDLGLIKFFSSRTIYTYEHLFTAQKLTLKTYR